MGFSQSWELAEQVLPKVTGRMSPGINTGNAKMAGHGADLEGGKEARSLLMASGNEEGRKGGLVTGVAKERFRETNKLRSEGCF